MKKALEVYIHIPFCVRKCAYCDFLSAPAPKEEQEQYYHALLQEIREFSDRDSYEVQTVFFGGGTPSLLPAEWIARILEELSRQFSFAVKAGRSSADSSNPDRMRAQKATLASNPDRMRAREATLACNPDRMRVQKITLASNPDRMRAQEATLACNYDRICVPEITLECNPGTANPEKLAIWRDAGINRLSLGLQSADAGELALLGRIHTWEDFLQTYEQARKAGFSNINVDLMSALPGQTADSWERTLRSVLALRPEHISAYSLIIEEGTPFYERYHADDVRRARGDVPELLPSEEEERLMYFRTQELLREAGLYRYEISNYALPGCECRHNIGYWTGVDYVGFGIGASSLLHHIRYRNTEEMVLYLRRYGVGAKSQGCASIQGSASESRSGSLVSGSATRGAPFSGISDIEYNLSPTNSFDPRLPVRTCEPLTQKDEIEEFMFLGLRLTAGVSEAEFERRFGRTVEEVYHPVLQKLIHLQLLQSENGAIRLTPRGLDLSNQVMAEFLLPG